MNSKRKPDNIAFSVSITPKRSKTLEEEEVLVAVLAPFNAYPKVEFEGVRLNHEATREVILINPNKACVSVELTKLPDQEWKFSSTEFELPGETKTKLSIQYTPADYGSSRHSVKIINKKNKKPMSEIILITSTEDPPKRRFGTRMQATKLKSTNTISSTKSTRLVENKENIIYEVNNTSVPCKKESSTTQTQSSQNTTFSKSSATITKKKHSKSSATITKEKHVSATVTSASVSALASEATGVAEPAQRKLTYEVLTPEKCKKYQSFSLRSKAMSTVLEIEKEKELFETIASPGLHNESLEKAASQLVQVESTRSNLVFPNVTFSLHEPVSATPFRRETYEVFTPFNRQKAIGERIVQGERSAWRVSLASRDGSDSLEDSLEVAEKTFNKDKLFDNLDKFGCDSVSLSVQESNLAMVTCRTEAVEEDDPTVAAKNKSSITPKVLLMDMKSVEDLDLTKTVHLSETVNKETNDQTEVRHVIGPEVTEQRQEGSFEYTFTAERKRSERFSSEIVYSDSLNSETSKEYMAKLNEIDNLNFSVSSSRRSSEIPNSPSCSAGETFKEKESDKEFKVNIEISELSPTEDDVFFTSSPIEEPTCLKELSSFTQTKKDSIKLSGTSIKSDSISKNSIVQQSIAAEDNRYVEIKKDQAWNVSPPKKSKQEDESSKRYLNNMPTVKRSLLTVGRRGRSSQSSTSTKKEDFEIPLIEVSSKGFALPTLAVKRPLKLSSNNSPPKLRKVEVKRLSCTPNAQRKSGFSTPMQSKGNNSAKSSLAANTISARKRSSVKVTSWVQSKLRLFRSSQSGDSELASPTELKDLATPDPFLAATSLNPFEKGGLYYSEDWLQEQEIDVIRWADRVLHPPSELQLDRDQTGTLYRLTALRGAAFSLLVAPETQAVLSKVKLAVDKNIIAVRKDKKLHVDLGLQDQIVKLLMCYNPLWLRLCLEAIYQCNIHLRYHADEAGLKNFIRNKLLRDQLLASKYCHPTLPHRYLPEFEEKMKTFTLYKFLVLVYLLDLAKTKKLIFHDPCLFKKDSKIKNSKDILIEFNKELITGAGDINKKLRVRGYEVVHEQKYLDEYDFSLTCRAELRDGVKLTKLAEIVTGNNSLLTKLRVPAVSLMTKRHNAEVALSSLKSAGHKFPDDITPKDIAEGHKEKTLSLLWHIRGIIQERAVRLILAKWRQTRQMRQDRKLFLQKKKAIEKIKKWYKNAKQQEHKSEDLIKKAIEARASFMRMKSAAVVIQKCYKRYLLAKKQRLDFLKKRSAVIVIQRKFRATILMKEKQKMFSNLKFSVIFIQRRFRANQLMKIERSNFLKLRSAATVIQRRFRTNLLMKKERDEYHKLQSAAKVIQRKFRSIILVKKYRELHSKGEIAACCIQRWYRAKLLKRRNEESLAKKTQEAVANSLQLRHKAAVTLQAIWRGIRVRRSVVVPKPEVNPTNQDRYQQTLNKRGQFFLGKIKDLKHITVAQLLNILINLDTLTYISADQCDYFANNGVVPILYSVIASANKASGVDHCTELCFQILCNLYRAPRTSHIVWQDTLQCGGLEQFGDVMLKNRLDKRNSIFCRALTLMWLFTRDPVKVEVIKKSEIIANLKYAAKDKAKLQAASNSAKTKKSHKSKNEMPSLTTNWGRYFKKHLRSFEDKVLALESVCKDLNLS